MYKQVLDQNNIKLCSIYACERVLVTSLDLTVMTQPSHYATFVETLASQGYVLVTQSDFSSYIENYMLQLMLEQGCSTDVVFNSLIAAVFFFTANDDPSGAEAVIRIFKMGYQINSTFLKKVDKSMAQLAGRLKLKGNSDELVESVMQKMDLRSIFY